MLVGCVDLNFGTFLIAFTVVSTVLVFKDAKSRGMNAVLWLFIILLSSFIGLAIYLIIRRPKLQGNTNPPQINSNFCTNCGAARLSNERFCTSCGTEFETIAVSAPAKNDKNHLNGFGILCLVIATIMFAAVLTNVSSCSRSCHPCVELSPPHSAPSFIDYNDEMTEIYGDFYDSSETLCLTINQNADSDKIIIEAEAIDGRCNIEIINYVQDWKCSYFKVDAPYGGASSVFVYEVPLAKNTNDAIYIYFFSSNFTGTINVYQEADAPQIEKTTQYQIDFRSAEKVFILNQTTENQLIVKIDTNFDACRFEIFFENGKEYQIEMSRDKDFRITAPNNCYHVSKLDGTLIIVFNLDQEQQDIKVSYSAGMGSYGCKASFEIVESDAVYCH